MSFRKGLLLFLLFFTSFGYSQTGINLHLGTSPWHIVHNFDDISRPMSLAYSGGLQFEQSLASNGFGIVTGIEYTYSQPGTSYADLTDKLNLLAVVYEEKINKDFINSMHHELTVPVMFVFYHGGLRTSIGASYSRYFFEEKGSPRIYRGVDDFGLRAMTGARISKRIIFSFGYYYGLNQILAYHAPVSDDFIGVPIKGNMQQFKICIGISLFNKMDNDIYYLGR
ncbi:MAG: hypothetical protein PF541_03325 [Prolixibacteraceae bacterium]|jgi:hypothetical protein|nr:hypothetical protein [Prolixibacteraceae bacterium]